MILITNQGLTPGSYFLGGSTRVINEMILKYICYWLRAELYKRGSASLGVEQKPPAYMKELAD